MLMMMWVMIMIMVMVVPKTAFKNTEKGSCVRGVSLLSFPAIPKYLWRHKLISDLLIDDDDDDADCIDLRGDNDDGFDDDDRRSLSALSLARRFKIMQRAVLSLPLYKKLVISVHSRSLIQPDIFCSNYNNGDDNDDDEGGDDDTNQLKH